MNNIEDDLSREPHSVLGILLLPQTQQFIQTVTATWTGLLNNTT
jgi:hypothetical protein